MSVFIELFEAVEYLVLVLLGDSATGITNGEKGRIFRLFHQFQGDSALCSKLCGVDKQIDQYLLQAGTVVVSFSELREVENRTSA